ncbi:MAG: cytochrome bo3 quinol oxidase subunit 3 [Deltaproteobacteria bacterium]|nr:cytochrome bo3 quinol oxidase subunit 3 [Deltaproteobacteria bacterium]
MNTITAPARPAEAPFHYDSAANREFGFWLYIMSDLILFAVLFATFAVLGRAYAGGPGARQLFSLPYVFAETILLVLSSAVYGIASSGARTNRIFAVMAGLGLAFLLGLGFIFMETKEFYQLIVDGNGPARSAFLSAYFTIVGTHGVHVLLGLIFMAVMIGQVLAKGLTAMVASRLKRLGMFWHFLDIVWIGIFSFVYLIQVI